MGALSSAATPRAPRTHSVQLSRLSDEALARQVARGSDPAFAALYERYHQQLYGYCRSIVRNGDDAQDVLQATFASALAALQRRQRKAPMRPWMFRIAHNEAISLIRRRVRDAAAPIEPELTAVQSVEDQVADRARWAQLRADLGELPERLRSALLLRELSGLSHEEVAIALETTPGAAKQAIFEARQALSELAQGRAMECEEICRRISAGDGRAFRGRRVRAHLRACAQCNEFAAAIHTRQADLRAFAPVLAPSAAAAVLSRAIGSHAVAHIGAGAVSTGAASSAATAGVAGKAAGVAFAWKAIAGAALVAATAAGVAGLTPGLRHHFTSAPVRAAAGAHGIAAGVRSPGSQGSGAAARLSAGRSSTVGPRGVARHAANRHRTGSGRGRAGAGAAASHGSGGAANHGASASAPGHSTSVSHGHAGLRGHGHAKSTTGHSRGLGAATHGSTGHRSTTAHGRSGAGGHPSHPKQTAGGRSSGSTRSASSGSSTKRHVPRN